MRFAIATLFAASATATSHVGESSAACTTFKDTAKLSFACNDDDWSCSCTGAPAPATACTAATTDAAKKLLTDAVAKTSAAYIEACGAHSDDDGHDHDDDTTEDSAATMTAGAAIVATIAALAF